MPPPPPGGGGVTVLETLIGLFTVTGPPLTLIGPTLPPVALVLTLVSPPLTVFVLAEFPEPVTPEVEVTVGPVIPVIGAAVLVLPF